MSIRKALGRVGVVLSVAVMVVCGQVESVKIGDLTWTKQNINIKTPDSWCYGDDDSNCAKYGRLYTWGAAKKACASMGGKWRLPTRGDWHNLLDYAGGDVAGKKLKSKSGWNENGDGTDDYEFSALPGGYRDGGGSFYSVGGQGVWWSEAEGGDGAYDWYTRSGSGRVREDNDKKSNGYSVRCVKE